MSLPLWRRRVVVTRPRSRAGGWVEAFTEAGADVILFPLFTLAPVSAEDNARTVAVFQELACEENPWLACTSVSSVCHFLAILDGAHLTELLRDRFQIASVGHATRHVLEARGLSVDLQPERASGAELAAAILKKTPKPTVLHPTSSRGLPHVSDTINQGGGHARRVVVTLHQPNDTLRPELLERELRNGGIHLVTFASPSAAEIFHACLPESLTKKFCGRPALAVGDTTQKALLKLGYKFVTTAKTPAVTDVISAAVKTLRE
ncbi:MAG: uroporphyrinogen-III synthase [Planctomycetota bacterium]